MSTTSQLTDDLIEFYRTYYRDEIGQLAQQYPREQRSLTIDYRDVYRFSPDLADDVEDQPQDLIEYFEEALRLYDLPVDVEFSNVNVRFENLPDHQTYDVADVSRYENIGRLLAVRGQVSKTSKVKPRVVEAAFECQRCGLTSRVPQLGESIQKPHECEGCERQGPFRLDSSRSEWTDHQFARVQQPPERTKGGDGVTVDVHLEDDIIQAFEAGDRVQITGILDTEDEDDSRDFDTVLNANAVTREESDYEDIDVDEHLDEIRAIANGDRGNPYELLVGSINPGHYGDEDVKLAIALQMFGGWSRGDETSERGDSHILMMGDPGCGKSTFLSEVDKLAPRSTYASGKGASASGLTAAAVSDDFGDTEWGLEAGALVLADGGVACIDEIDKIDDDAVSSLHDALESQKVRVNKAGINATLSARTAMLAAGNPEHGRFNDHQPRADQLDLSPTLLSRFDLMFMVSDSPDAEEDREVIEHMMRSRRASAKRALGEDLTDEEEDSVEPDIPLETLRAYIAHAKQEVQPYIHEENEAARERLREEFLELRLANQDSEDSPVPVTFRKQEAIERLAEASARVRLDDRVREEDVERALGLVKKSMRQVGVDPETGQFDADIVATGTSKTQQERIDTILAVLEDQGGLEVDELCDLVSFDEQKVRDEVSNLKQRGEIYRRSGKLRRVK
jgi:replicative DNA helicase Mcm